MIPLRCLLVFAVLVVAAPGRTDDDLGRAHDFRLRTADGATMTLDQALADGPILLDFWATWCAPCKVALPRWDALAKAYSEHGVRLITISQDDPRSQPKILPYMRSQGFDFPALLDGDKQVGRRYRVTSLPTTFLIAKDGRIVTHHVGYRDGDEHEVEDDLRALLGLEPLPEESR